MSLPPYPTTPSLLLIVPLWIVAGLLTVGSMYFARNILVPLAVALLLAALFQPLVRWLRKRVGMNAPFAALFCVVFLVGIQVLGGIWSAVGIRFLFEELPSVGRKISKLLTENPSLQKFLPSEQQLTEFFNGGGQAIQHIEFGAVFAAASNFAAQWILVMFMTFFYLAEGDWLLGKMALVFGQTSDGIRRVGDTFERIGRQFVRFMVVRTMINIGLGLFVATSLYFMEVPYWQTWGILAAVLTYIPYLGPLASAAPPMLLLMLKDPEQGGGIGAVVLLFALYCIIFVLEGYVAVPMLMGKSLDLNATTVMIACLFWWFVWGEVGLVLAIPFTAAIRLTMAEIHGLRYWSDLMSADSGH